MKLKIILLLAVLAALCSFGSSSALAQNCSLDSVPPGWNQPFFSQWNTGEHVTCDTDAQIQYKDVMYLGDSPALNTLAQNTEYYFASNGTIGVWSHHVCWASGYHWWGSYWNFRVSWNGGYTWGPWHISQPGAGSPLQCG